MPSGTRGGRVVVAAIVLAAGGSRRMGRPKQLLRWRGKTLLQHVIDTVESAGVDEIVVVLGSAADEIGATLELPPHARIVVNRDHRQGQRRSLRVGLAAAKDADGAIVVLGDEPDIDSSAIDLVLGRWRDGSRPIVRATYDGRPGHPVLLARSVWDELTGEADEGARSLIESRPQLVEDVAIPLERPRDVDTPEDFEELTGRAPQA